MGFLHTTVSLHPWRCLGQSVLRAIEDPAGFSSFTAGFLIWFGLVSLSNEREVMTLSNSQKLTIRQKAFADFYIELGNATEAARRAGYKDNGNLNRTASENLAKPVIKAYIDERLKQIDNERIASAAEVMKYLTAVLRGEETEEVVVVEGIGDGCSEARNVIKEISAKERIKAAELLGKRYALFTDKVNVDGNIPIVIKDDIRE